MPCQKQRKPRKKETKKRKKRIDTLWRLGGLEDLKGHPLKLALLERMAASEEGQRRFWAKVKKGNPDECWTWMGGMSNNGYGTYGISHTENRSAQIRPHRISHYLATGVFSELVDVCHRCDNPICVNPSHLFPGTQEDNILDMVKKNRHIKGEKSPRSKLTEKDVRSIRAAYATGNYSHADLALIYKVCRVSIRMVVIGRSWKHVK